MLIDNIMGAGKTFCTVIQSVGLSMIIVNLVPGC